MRRIPLLFAASMLAASLAANATWQSEVEPNDSAADAQSLDGYFDLSFNPLIGDDNLVNTSEDHPHAEVTGYSEVNVTWSEFPSPNPGSNTFDWYSFTITTPGSVGIIDIDCAWQNQEDECAGSGLVGEFDALVHLIDTDGTTRLTDTTGGDDDGNVVFGYPEEQDPGSNGGGAAKLASRDSFIVYTFDVPGTYFVRVGSFGGYAGDGSSIQQPPVGDYLLHVSIIVNDQDGDGVVDDFDLCPDTPAGQAVDPAGCPADDILESVADEIRALMGNANKDARKKLKKAGEKLGEARRKIGKGKVKDGLKKLKDVVKELKKAEKEGANTAGLIAKLVDYTRAEAQAAIAMSTNSKDVKKALKEMEKGEKELRKGKPDKAIQHFAKAYEKVTKDDDDDSSSDDDSSDDDSSD